MLRLVLHFKARKFKFGNGIVTDNSTSGCYCCCYLHKYGTSFCNRLFWL